MDPRSNFDGLVASVTFTGSLLSLLATTAVLISYIYYRHEQRSFRHALVFNLALAEFINTLNNTVSGSIYLRDHALWPGTACTINGFIGQLSVQAADFSILVIAVVTLLTITRTTYMPAASSLYKFLICGAVWVIPIITATIATGLGRMEPVSGNWCWIDAGSTDLRYALTHGWRIAIIFCTVAIYAFVWWYMNRHFRSLVSTMTDEVSVATKGSWYRRRGFRKMPNGAASAAAAGGAALPAAEANDLTELSTMSKSRISRIGDDGWEMSAPEAALVRESMELVRRSSDFFNHNDPRRAEEGGRWKDKSRQRGMSSSFSDSDSSDHDERPRRDERQQQQQYGHHPRLNDPDRNVKLATVPPHHQPQHHHKRIPSLMPKSKFNAGATTDTTASEFPTRRQTRQMEREIKRMLLLNAYPIMYVILWIPGLVNRFMEATGHASDSRVLAALQSSSQFVGLANALTYGFNTALRTKFKKWWRKRRPGK